MEEFARGPSDSPRGRRCGPGCRGPRTGTGWRPRIAPIRSTSALVLSSTNINRDRIYVQQPPVSASGFSSQAFNPHYPHTERKVETKTCSDCHLSKQNDNNAIMAQLLMHGTGYVNFMGRYCWVAGGKHGLAAVVVQGQFEPRGAEIIGSGGRQAMGGASAVIDGAGQPGRWQADAARRRGGSGGAARRPLRAGVSACRWPRSRAAGSPCTAAVGDRCACSGRRSFPASARPTPRCARSRT